MSHGARITYKTDLLGCLLFFKFLHARFFFIIEAGNNTDIAEFRKFRAGFLAKSFYEPLQFLYRHFGRFLYLLNSVEGFILHLPAVLLQQSARRFPRSRGIQ